MIAYEDLTAVNQVFVSEYQVAAQQVIESGWYILGEQVTRFEKNFAAYCGTEHCIGVANGLDAIRLSLAVLDLPVGSEVIVASNVYIACILGIVQAGLVPVLVEPDAHTYNLDPERIKSAITTKTRAILAVHLYGKMAEMPTIMQLADAYDLYVIEDAAQAHGASIQGRKAGSWGHLSAFSFYPTKNLGCLGDGGAITTNNAVWDEKLQALRNYGSHKKYHNYYMGINSRLDEIQAAFLNIKLPHLDAINSYKKRLAAIYDQQLNAAKFVQPVKQTDYDDIYHIYAIRHPHRDRLKSYLLEQGIKTEIHYPLAPYEQTAYQHLFQGTYPIAQMLHQTQLSLPISYGHTEDDIMIVCQALEQFQ